jgi:hypothetical protein
LLLLLLLLPLLLLLLLLLPLLQVRIRTSQEMAAMDDNERISLAQGAYL